MLVLPSDQESSFFPIRSVIGHHLLSSCLPPVQSFPRRRNPVKSIKFWTPAFAGVTPFLTFLRNYQNAQIIKNPFISLCHSDIILTVQHRPHREIIFGLSLTSKKSRSTAGSAGVKVAEKFETSHQIDLNEFKLYFHLKGRAPITLHFNSPSRRFYSRCDPPWLSSR